MKYELPPGLAASLDATRAPRVVFIRHADRPPILDSGSGPDVLLNDLGRRRAQTLGRWIGKDLTWAAASPIERCMETARHAGMEPEPSELLGEPGAFVVNPKRGAEVFRKLGTEAMVRRQIAGELLGCFRPLEEGVRRLLDYFATQMARRGGTGLAVTHDAIIVAFVAWCTGQRFEDDWIGYLDGSVVVPEGLVWQGRLYEVPK